MILKILVLLFASKEIFSREIHVINKNIENRETQENFLVQILDNEKQWWQTATFYQIYPRSFKDSNGDGIGDLNGIIEKLDYIAGLGVQAIWMSPIFQSPQKDNGYDISDYRNIQPEYGTFDDFLKLIDEAHKRGIKVIIDFVPNHTSNLHEWFQRSENKEEGYTDYYVWLDPKFVNGTRVPPNNWISAFKGPAWEWSDKRQQYYLHDFLKEQPDLNYRNEKVQQEMKDILKFWLEDHNVDGVRIDAVSHLVEDINFSDEPRSYINGSTPNDYEYLIHNKTKDQPETYEIVYSWRKYLDEISERTNSVKVEFTEAGDTLANLVRYFGTEDGSTLGAHFSFNFILLALNQGSTATDLQNLVNTWLTALPKIYTSNWLLGNHDNHRIASKVAKEAVDALNMLTGFLPGIQIIYNGEEIGMEDGNVSCSQGQDLADNCDIYDSVSRDFERTPFQWDTTSNAGFSNTTGNTWLPVSDKYLECNVADQTKDPKSSLNILTNLQKIRPRFINLNQYDSQIMGDDQTVFHFYRYEGMIQEPTEYIQYNYLVNFGNKEISELVLADGKLFSEYELLLASGNSDKSIGDYIDPVKVHLKPYEAIILALSVKSNSDSNIN